MEKIEAEVTLDFLLINRVGYTLYAHGFYENANITGALVRTIIEYNKCRDYLYDQEIILLGHFKVVYNRDRSFRIKDLNEEKGVYIFKDAKGKVYGFFITNKDIKKNVIRPLFDGISPVAAQIDPMRPYAVPLYSRLIGSRVNHFVDDLNRHN